ncbi:MAG: 6-phospho-3-hexuloisomerase [Candidatus Pacebacteria bacterium]|nr:6-phospho-3-hexuloisomerase [Candidatus Paceibacterota bacterium]
MFKNTSKNILAEIDQVLSKTKEEKVSLLIEELLKAKAIITLGAGRVGMVARAFAMRLGHLGLKAFMVGDSTVPSIGKGDLLLVCSGSGETQTIFDLTKIAKKNRAVIVLITGNKNSRIGKLADVTVEIKAPSKTKKIAGFNSIQPMTTLNEQCLSIFFDSIVLQLMQEMDETHETMWARHSNLE